MGLLNWLFGSEADKAKRLVMDDARRETLWKEHLSNFGKRKQLADRFDFRRIKDLVIDQEFVTDTIDPMEALISSEFITVEEEEKEVDTILGDIAHLKTEDEVFSLSGSLVSLKKKEDILRELFQEIYRIIRVEINLIRAIKRNPTKELLSDLYRVIKREFFAYSKFSPGMFLEEDRDIHGEIVRVARAILLEQKIEEKIETAEEEFARLEINSIADKMEPESKHRYRKLAEAIFDRLLNEVGAPVSPPRTIDDALTQMESIINNDTDMFRIVKTLRRRYPDQKIRQVVQAFRRAYGYGHFHDWEGGLTT